MTATFGAPFCNHAFTSPILIDPEAEADLLAFMLEDPESAAIVRFNAFGRDITHLKDIRDGRRWYLPADRIPELNRCLRYLVVIVARRDSL